MEDLATKVFEWKRRRQMELDPGFQLTNARGDFQETILQGDALWTIPGVRLIVPAAIKAHGFSRSGIRRFGLVHQGLCLPQGYGVSVLSEDKIHIFFLAQRVHFRTREMRIAT